MGIAWSKDLNEIKSYKKKIETSEIKLEPLLKILSNKELDENCVEVIENEVNEIKKEIASLSETLEKLQKSFDYNSDSEDDLTMNYFY